MTRFHVRSSPVLALLALFFIAFASLDVLAQRGGGRAGGSGGTAGTRSAGPSGVRSPVAGRPAGPSGRVAIGQAGPRAPVASHVVVAGYPYRYGYRYGYGYPYGWYPWYGYGAWAWNFGWGFGWGYPYPYYAGYYPYAYPYGYPYPYGGYGVYSASLKLEVTPKTAEVYVDGYLAGVVDDFDGTFQHLEMPPGEHELVLYQDGYRTVQQKVVMAGKSDQRVKYAMEKLAPGESSGPRPTPPAEPAPEQQQQQPPAQPRRSPQQVPPPDPAQAPEAFGMISIRTQPVDAEILVDGEAWERSSATSRLVIQLAPGRHRVEVRKTGFATYSEEVLIRAGATMTLNVSLLRGGER